MGDPGILSYYCIGCCILLSWGGSSHLEGGIELYGAGVLLSCGYVVGLALVQPEVSKCWGC